MELLLSGLFNLVEQILILWVTDAKILIAPSQVLAGKNKTYI